MRFLKGLIGFYQLCSSDRLGFTRCHQATQTIFLYQQKYISDLRPIRLFHFMLKVPIILFIFPINAFAHESALLGFQSGLLHPVLGLDHLLAMVSVGVISYQIGKKAIWLVPVTFVAIMSMGGILGLIGIGLIGIEFGIAFSVLALGFSISKSEYFTVTLIYIFVGIFAIFHGYAHGQEIPEIAKSWSYVLGFMIGTSFIHIFGVGISHIANKTKNGSDILRYSGAIISGMGLHMMLAMAGL